MPPEVQKLLKAIESIDGVTDASVAKIDLASIPADDLDLLPYGDLPIGSLRRTAGGLPHELLITVNFGVTPDIQGHKAVEFISWWVRDASRGGEPMQLRSVALPPILGQFGHTLRFIVEYFHKDPAEDVGSLLAKIEELAEDLLSSQSFYQDALLS